MFVQNSQNQTLIEVLNPEDLFNPVHATVQGRQQDGEEEQPPEDYSKDQLVFPSGEPLPQCWVDPDYQL